MNWDVRECMAILWDGRRVMIFICISPCDILAPWHCWGGWLHGFGEES
jgi:hypothetical protein